MPIQRRIREFLLYVLASLAGVSLDIVSRLFYDLFMDFTWSVVAAYFTGMFAAFTMNKLITFSASKSGNTRREMMKYFLVTGTALGVRLLVSEGLLAWFMASFQQEFDQLLALINQNNFLQRTVKLETLIETSAHIFSIGFSFVVNFFGHKYLSFRSTGIWELYRAYRK